MWETTPLEHFFDLKKASDAVDQNSLLEKLDYCGIKGVARNCLESYLNNRKTVYHMKGVMKVNHLLLKLKEN